MNKLDGYVQELREFFSEVLHSLHRITAGMEWRKNISRIIYRPFTGVTDAAGAVQIDVGSPPQGTIRKIQIMTVTLPAVATSCRLFWDGVDSRRTIVNFGAITEQTFTFTWPVVAHSGRALILAVTGTTANTQVSVSCQCEEITVPAGFQERALDTQDGRSTHLPMEPGAPAADEGTRWGTGPLIREEAPTHEHAGGEELEHAGAIQDNRK